MSKLHRKQKERQLQPQSNLVAAVVTTPAITYDESEPIDELEALTALEALDDLLEAEAATARGVTDVAMGESSSAHHDPAVETPPTPIESAIQVDVPTGNGPTSSIAPLVSLSSDLAHQIAKEAVERVLGDQAEARLFDVFNNRLTITLPDDDLTVLEAQWREHNSKIEGNANAKLPFSAFVATRLRGCRSHDASRAIYVGDAIRQSLEKLFGDVIYSETDLANKIDRHLRPIIQSPDNPTGIMRLKPLDPLVVEIVPGWYPDKSPVDALSDFINDAVREKAGLA